MRTIVHLINDRAVVWRYAAAAFVAIALRAAVLLTLFPLVTELFDGRPVGALSWLAVLMVLVAASWFAEERLVTSGFSIGFDHFLTNVEDRLRNQLDDLPPGWFDTRRRSETQQALTLAGQELCQAIAYVLTPAVSAFGATVLTGVGLFWVHPMLGAVALAGAAAVGIALWASGRFIRTADAANARASQDVGQHIVEFARSQRILRAADRAADVQSDLGSAFARQRRATVRLLLWNVPGRVVFSLVYQASLLGLAAVAVHLFLTGELTAAQVAAVIVILVRFLEPFVTLSELAPAVEIVRNAVDRVNALLEAPTLPKRPTSSGRVPAAPALEFRDVVFSYAGAAPVLAGVSMVVPRGSTTAIVGPSGAGKTTLLSLAARVADVDGGAVLVDGVDVRDLLLDDLLAGLAMVHQDTYLFDGTLRANVQAGTREVDDLQLRAACSAAQLDDVIDRLPGGWDARVGEDGDLLSGGERQRVSIARAIARRAPLLLLDEATSALDPLTERGLVSALRDREPGTTVVIVAHRLATIAMADQIVFVEDGRVVERGTLTSLLDLGGRFADYWRIREQAGTWALTS